MATKNNYEDTGKTVQFKKSYAHRETKESFVPIDTALGLPNTQRRFPIVDFPKPLNKAPVKEQKTEIPQIVKDAINDKIVQLLKDRGIYNEIIELLNYGGFSTIKIKKDND